MGGEGLRWRGQFSTKLSQHELVARMQCNGIRDNCCETPRNPLRFIRTAYWFYRGYRVCIWNQMGRNRPTSHWLEKRTPPQRTGSCHTSDTPHLTEATGSQVKQLIKLVSYLVVDIQRTPGKAFYGRMIVKVYGSSLFEFG